MTKPIFREPKIGDRVILIDDESEGVIKQITIAGGPIINFDDGTEAIYTRNQLINLFTYKEKESKMTADDVINILRGGQYPGDYDEVAAANCIENLVKELKDQKNYLKITFEVIIQKIDLCNQLQQKLEDCTCQGGHSEAYLKAKGKL
jgi:hypothetical protein